MVQDVLVQQGLIDALKGTKPDKTTDEEWKVMEQKSVNTIQLCLFAEVRYSIVGNERESPKKLWKSLEEM